MFDDFFKELKYRRVKKYTGELADRLTCAYMELEDIKKFFTREGFRYIGKKQLQISKYIYNLVFILLYHPKYGFIITVWSNTKYNPQYNLKALHFWSYDIPVSECRQALRSSMESHIEDVLNERKELFGHY